MPPDVLLGWPCACGKLIAQTHLVIAWGRQKLSGIAYETGIDAANDKPHPPPGLIFLTLVGRQEWCRIVITRD